VTKNSTRVWKYPNSVLESTIVNFGYLILYLVYIYTHTIKSLCCWERGRDYECARVLASSNQHFILFSTSACYAWIVSMGSGAPSVCVCVCVCVYACVIDLTVYNFNCSDYVASNDKDIQNNTLERM
jgi:hypothetical protein